MQEVQEIQVRSYETELGWEDPLEKWKPTAVFLLGKSLGKRNLAICSLWGCLESADQVYTHRHTHFNFELNRTTGIIWVPGGACGLYLKVGSDSGTAPMALLSCSS